MKLDLLEKKLNIASDFIEEFDIDCITDIIPTTTSKNEIVVKSDIEEHQQPEVFSLDTLKNDFIIIRQNVMKLINSGQRILETASLLDISDLKASQLMAISNLQKTLGENLKSLIDIYRQAVEIEKLRLKEKPNNTNDPSSNIINSGTVINNQILYSGSTSDLLGFIKENQNS